MKHKPLSTPEKQALAWIARNWYAQPKKRWVRILDSSGSISGALAIKKQVMCAPSSRSITGAYKFTIYTLRQPVRPAIMRPLQQPLYDLECRPWGARSRELLYFARPRKKKQRCNRNTKRRSGR